MGRSPLEKNEILDLSGLFMISIPREQTWSYFRMRSGIAHTPSEMGWVYPNKSKHHRTKHTATEIAQGHPKPSMCCIPWEHDLRYAIRAHVCVYRCVHINIHMYYIYTHTYIYIYIYYIYTVYRYMYSVLYIYTRITVLTDSQLGAWKFHLKSHMITRPLSALGRAKPPCPKILRTSRIKF